MGGGRRFIKIEHDDTSADWGVSIKDIIKKAEQLKAKDKPISKEAIAVIRQLDKEGDIEYNEAGCLKAFATWWRRIGNAFFNKEATLQSIDKVAKSSLAAHEGAGKEDDGLKAAGAQAPVRQFTHPEIKFAFKLGRAVQNGFIKDPEQCKCIWDKLYAIYDYLARNRSYDLDMFNEFIPYVRGGFSSIENSFKSHKFNDMLETFYEKRNLFGKSDTTAYFESKILKRWANHDCFSALLCIRDPIEKSKAIIKFLDERSNSTYVAIFQWILISGGGIAYAGLENRLVKDFASLISFNKPITDSAIKLLIEIYKHRNDSNFGFKKKYDTLIDYIDKSLDPDNKKIFDQQFLSEINKIDDDIRRRWEKIDDDIRRRREKIDEEMRRAAEEEYQREQDRRRAEYEKQQEFKGQSAGAGPGGGAEGAGASSETPVRSISDIKKEFLDIVLADPNTKDNFSEVNATTQLDKQTVSNIFKQWSKANHPDKKIKLPRVPDVPIKPAEVDENTKVEMDRYNVLKRIYDEKMKEYEEGMKNYPQAQEEYKKALEIYQKANENFKKVLNLKDELIRRLE